MNEEQFFMMSWGTTETRLDPNFYHPIYRNLLAKIASGNSSSLREICRLSTEFWDQKTGYAGSFPYLEISEVDTKTGAIGRIESVEIGSAPSRARVVVRHGDIIISTTRPARGAIALVGSNSEAPFIASTGFSVVRETKPVVTKSYLLAVLRSRISLLQFEQRSSGGNYPAITASELKRVKIPLPGDEIQDKVVKKYQGSISRFESALSEADALLASIDDYLLAELDIALPPEPDNTIDKRMFRTKSSDLGGWRFDARVHQYDFNLHSATYPNAKLGTICAINPKTVFRGLNETDDVSFVPMDAISDRLGIIEKRDTRVLAENVGYTSFREGDLLWAKITPCMENGKSAVAEGLHRGFGYGSTEYHVLRSPDGSLDMGYLHALLRMKRVRKAAVRFFTGASGHQRVDADFLRTLELPVPPLDVQKALAAEARARVARAVQLEEEANADLDRAKAEIEAILLGDAA